MSNPGLDPALLAAILAEPDADAIRRIAADWLEEHGQAERAEFVRVQCELARREGYAGTNENNWSVELHKRMSDLRIRERELLDPDWFPSFLRLAIMASLDWYKGYLPLGQVRRGFIHGVACTAADWLANGDAITAAQPVQEVTLTTWPETRFWGGGPSIKVCVYFAGSHRRLFFEEGTLLTEMLRAEWPRVRKWTLPETFTYTPSNWQGSPTLGMP